MLTFLISFILKQMEIRSDLMDAHMYAFKRFEFLLYASSKLLLLQCRLSFSNVALSMGYYVRSALQDVLNQKEKFRSLRRDVLPYLVLTQLVSFSTIIIL